MSLWRPQSALADACRRAERLDGSPLCSAALHSALTRCAARIFGLAAHRPHISGLGQSADGPRWSRFGWSVIDGRYCAAAMATGFRYGVAAAIDALEAPEGPLRIVEDPVHFRPAGRARHHDRHRRRQPALAVMVDRTEDAIPSRLQCQRQLCRLARRQLVGSRNRSGFRGASRTDRKSVRGGSAISDGQPDAGSAKADVPKAEAVVMHHDLRGEWFCAGPARRGRQHR